MKYTWKMVAAVIAAPIKITEHLLKLTISSCRVMTALLQKPTTLIYLFCKKSEFLAFRTTRQAKVNDIYEKLTSDTFVEYV